jgi:hypothetical protein
LHWPGRDLPGRAFSVIDERASGIFGIGHKVKRTLTGNP